MAKTRSITRNQYPGAAPWLDLNRDALFLVMMQLGVVDFVAFSGVCKSWRSFALSNWPSFMASKPPMFVRISPPGHKDACYLIDFEGRKFKTILPHLVGRTCFGSTCGYLILYGSKERRDICLVNPITRHQLHFPKVPLSPYYCEGDVRAILVLLPSISGRMFVLVYRYTSVIWFSIAGKDSWNHILYTSPIWDLHAFNGKIYILSGSWLMMNLHELKLNPEPKLTLLDTKNFRKPHLSRHLVSSNENVYFVGYDSEDKDLYTIHELDFDRMKWVTCEKTSEEYAFFLRKVEKAGFLLQTCGTSRMIV